MSKQRFYDVVLNVLTSRKRRSDVVCRLGYYWCIAATDQQNTCVGEQNKVEMLSFADASNHAFLL